MSIACSVATRLRPTTLYGSWAANARPSSRLIRRTQSDTRVVRTLRSWETKVRQIGIKIGQADTEANNADVQNTEESGVELYRGFVEMALKHAIRRDAAWYVWHASKRHSMVKRVWSEFGAYVHQQIIWVKSRPVLTYSVYFWQHEPCLFSWIKGAKPKTFRAQIPQTSDGFPTTVWHIRVPRWRPMPTRLQNLAGFLLCPWNCTPNAATSAQTKGGR